MDILKPDAKALVWLAIGYFVLPLAVGTVMGLLSKGKQ